MLMLKLLSGLLVAVCRIVAREPKPPVAKPKPVAIEPESVPVAEPKPVARKPVPATPEPSQVKHGFAVGDRVQRRGKNGCIGTVKGCPTPILRGWPERVTVRWDRHGAEFDRNCNGNPQRDHVSPRSILRVAA